MIVNDLLSIIDRLIQLTEYRHRRYRLLFESLVEPAFAELLLVHGDYIRMFEETRRLLPRRSRQGPLAGQIADLQKPAEYLGQKRTEFEPVREKLRALATCMKDVELDPDVKCFIDAVVDYFHQWLPKGGSVSADLLGMIEDSVRRGEMSSDEFDQSWEFIDGHISALIDGHKQHWSSVCETFAPLKVRFAKM
jgi:hypothetical protein